MRESTPFRLQELIDTQIKTEITGTGIKIEDIYGHRYDVYYYKYRVGLLQVSASPIVSGDIQDVGCRVHVDIELDPFGSVFISFDEMVEFLKCLARMLSDASEECEYPDYKDMTEQRYVENTIELALTRALWNRDERQERQNPKRPSLEIWFSGMPSEWYQYISRQKGKSHS